MIPIESMGVAEMDWSKLNNALIHPYIRRSECENCSGETILKHEEIKKIFFNQDIVVNR